MQFSNMPYQRSFQKNLISYFAYLALCLLVSNLKFHVSNSKKEKRVFTPLMKAPGQISSAKCQGPCSCPCPCPTINQALLMLLLFCALLCLCGCLSYPLLSYCHNCCVCASESARALALFYATHIQPVAGRVFSCALSNLFLARNALSHLCSPSRCLLSLN